MDTAIQLIKAQGTSLEIDSRQVAEVLELVMEITREYRADRRDFSVSLLGQELQKRMNPGEFQRTGKGRARVLAQALEAHGLLKLVSRDFLDWIFLPEEPAELINVAPISFEGPRYDYTGLVYTDLPQDKREKVIMAVNNETSRPGTDWLTFKRVMQAVSPIVDRDEFAMKNLVNNMLAHGILRYDQSRQGRDPETGSTYDYRTIALDLQHPDVRQALHLG